MSDLILHHYDFSNYSEKVRVALGFKSLDWASVTIPPVLPKPNLALLTGGYRRAPVLQIGADIYCDTRLILQELERRHGEPTLFPRGHIGLANAVSAWAEGPLFRSVMLYAWGTNHDLMPPELFEDRARMRGLPTPSVTSVERAAARNAPLVRTQLPFIEDMLGDGRPWLCGERFTVADLAVFHAMWFLTDRSSRLAYEFDRFESLRVWMSRVRDFGHGRHSVHDRGGGARRCKIFEASAVPPVGSAARGSRSRKHGGNPCSRLCEGRHRRKARVFGRRRVGGFDAKRSRRGCRRPFSSHRFRDENSARTVSQHPSSRWVADLLGGPAETTPGNQALRF